MAKFRSTIEDCNLVDLGYEGVWFTWQRGHKREQNVMERLDIFLATLEWCEKFPNFKVHNLTSPYSDHHPIFINLENSRFKRIKNMKKPIRFESLWCKENACAKIVGDEWGKNVVEPIKEKLGRTIGRLKGWHDGNIKHNRSKIDDLNKELEVLLSKNPVDPILEQVQSIKVELNCLMEQEEMFWRQ
ncbi:hypothetical protein DITRI_Ditri17bG0021300 [Diplodiscus trichospermus]